MSDCRHDECCTAPGCRYTPAYEYAIRYGDEMVYDKSWECPADVIATYHGSFADTTGRVTGVLVRKADGGEWEEVYP